MLNLAVPNIRTLLKVLLLGFGLFSRRIFSSSTIGRGIVKRAHSTVPSSTLDLEEAVLSKPCCPRVFGKPVVHPSFVAVTNNRHLVDPAIVVAQPRGLNGCGDRVDVDQLLHISLICVPQVVLASHAAIGEVTIGC